VKRLGTLLRRRFTVHDQAAFARLSGDFNPVHVDPIEARRTIIGAPVVHGLHLVLAALEAACASAGMSAGLMATSARFRRPVLVGERIEMRIADIDASHWRVEGHIGGDLVLDLAVTLGPDRPSDNAAVAPLDPIPLHDLRFEELDGTCGALAVGLNAAAARDLFPRLAARLGLPILAELVALTRLVGMRCPGRHSIFGQFDVSFDRAGEPGMLNYRVTRTDERFLRLDMVVEGARLSGTLRAFLRPLPQPQPGIAEIARSVGREEFASSIAIVVGGSRGLGEATAKILAAGGARVTITYYRGEQDAARVAAEIRDWGGGCESVHLDVLRPGRTIPRIFAGRDRPRSIYYFATPHIFARRRAFFSPDLLQTFIDYYVTGFAALIDAAAERGGGKLAVFCPSSVAIDENMRELAEYCMAKRAAEDLCAFYNRFSQRISILTERLARTHTDQTSTLVPIPAAQGFDVMLPIVRRLERDTRNAEA